MKNQYHKINCINEIRQSKGMTFNDISKKSGISASAICDFANFKKNPSHFNMVKISHALGVKTEKVFELRYEKLFKNQDNNK